MTYRILQMLLMGLCLAVCRPVRALDKSVGDPLTPSHQPFSFIENKGQITDQHGRSRADIDFKVSAQGVHVFIGDGAIHYQWARPVNTEMSQTMAANIHPLEASPVNTPHTWDMYRMDVALVGADKNAPLIKESKLDYYERYYLPQCGPEGTTAYSYEKLTYKDVYPNIDWVLYVKDGHMKYDFVVHPGGRVSDIRLQYGGATSLKPDQTGGVTAFTPFGSVIEKTPVSFQEDGAEINSRFVLTDNTLGFAVAPYEGTLTIDPTLIWGTYYGEVAAFADGASDIAYDTFQGGDHIYICGITMNQFNIATTGTHQVNFAGEADAYLAKFNSAGIRQWGTYFGGTKTDGQASRIVCDTLGNIYMAGITYSPSGIATPGSFQDTLCGYDPNSYSNDNFLVKFDPTGNRLWATYYGGSSTEMYPDLATDGLSIYMLSSTSSTSGIATPGSYQELLGSLLPVVALDAYLVKFDSAGDRQWGTYYGGNKMDLASTLVYDKPGWLYLTGYTHSDTGIATSGSHQEMLGGTAHNRDAFIAKFSVDGVRQWGTYYGGDEPDDGTSVICDDSGYVYLAGVTQSSSGVAMGAVQQSTLSGGQDIFIAKFDSTGQRQWATYYGGVEDEGFPSICYGSGKVFLTASTFSLSGIATPGAYQSTNNATYPYWGTVFLAEFSSSLGIRNWATYYGGTKAETAGGIAYDNYGYLYIGGITGSESGISTPGSHRDTFVGLGHLSFLSKFCVTPNLSGYALDIAGPDTLCRSSNASYSIPEIEDVTAYIWTLPSGWSGSSDSNRIDITSGSDGGLIGVQIVRCEDTSAMQTYEVFVFPADPAVITVDGFVLGTVATNYTSYQWLYNDTLIPGATGSTYTVTANGDYKVITTDQRGCVDTSEAYTVKNYTGITDRNLANRIKLFPNPAKDRVLIQSPVSVTVLLSNMEGRVLLRQTNAQSIDISNLAPGIYILRILDRNGLLLKAEQLVKIVK